MKLKALALQLALSIMAASSLVSIAQAAILGGGFNQRGDGELILVVYDPVTEASYTKDLGLSVFPYKDGDKYTDNFHVYAQQDVGYQKFFGALNTDANFQQFLKVSTNAANQVWGVYAVGSVGDGFSPGDFRMFTTVNSDQWDGTGGVNPSYDGMLKTRTNFFVDPVQNIAQWQRNLDIGMFSDGVNPFSTHWTKNASGGVEPDPINFDYRSNGSSFDAKGSLVNLKYAGGLQDGAFGNTGFLTTNKIGSSSWFYSLGSAGDDGDVPILVDEFDNLTNDAYWGLAKADNGDYILSFTLAGTTAPTTTVLGLQRRNLTDFSALYGNVRALSAPLNEFIGWVPGGSVVNAVPEPSTYGLFALGLLMLGLRAKRQA